LTKLNRKVEYALISLRYMRGKKPGELTSVKEIVQTFSCSFDLTSRVLQRLTAAGILRSAKGAQGGYQIIKDLADISFFTLNDLLAEPMGLTRCVQPDGASCEIEQHCNIISPMKRFNQELKGFYQKLSVDSLLEERND